MIVRHEHTNAYQLFGSCAGVHLQELGQISSTYGIAKVYSAELVMYFVLVVQQHTNATIT